MQVELNITKKTRIDKVWDFQINGLTAHQKIIITTNMQDLFGNKWESEAKFKADNRGSVKLDRQAPIAGCYSGIDPMGLLWGMTCKDTHGLLARRFDLSPVEINIQIKNTQGTILAEENVTRYLIEPNIVISTVRENGLVGTLYQPSHEKVKKCPAVIVLSGSEGGFRHEQAALLASEGYVAFALAYFICDQSGYKDLPVNFPTEIKNIPLEYFAKAIQFLQQLPDVDPNKLAIVGTSRGGELALLLGSHFPEIKNVVAYVPSNLAQAAFGPSDHLKDEIEPSWTFQEKPISCAPLIVNNVAWFDNKPVILKNGFVIAATEKELTDKNIGTDAIISVENINGPILLISAGADEMWPSGTMSHAIMNRLKEKNHKYLAESQHVIYKNAGHLIMTPWWPTTGQHAVHPVDMVDYDFGGTPEADAKAGSESWEIIKQFLHQQLVIKNIL